MAGKQQDDERIQIDGLKVDLERVSVGEFAEFADLENARMLPLTERTRRQAAYLARWVVALPDGWGDPADEQTYLHLNMWDQWLPMVTYLWQSVEDVRKKAMTRYTTP